MTSVGATGISSSGTETAASFTSGGFSNYFGTPSYQASAVKSYLSSLGETYTGQYNTSGRAYPDVAAIGVDVDIILDNGVDTLEGTSCASPIFASVIALINDKLIAAGKSPLGFLNPFLYANPGAFNDITSGKCKYLLTCIHENISCFRFKPWMQYRWIRGFHGLGPCNRSGYTKFCCAPGSCWSVKLSKYLDPSQ